MMRNGTKKVGINIKIDPDLLEQLDELCEHRMAIRSAVILRGIEMVLATETEQKPPVPEKRWWRV